VEVARKKTKKGNLSLMNQPHHDSVIVF